MKFAFLSRFWNGYLENVNKVVYFNYCVLGAYIDLFSEVIINCLHFGGCFIVISFCCHVWTCYLWCYYILLNIYMSDLHLNLIQCLVGQPGLMRWNHRILEIFCNKTFISLCSWCNMLDYYSAYCINLPIVSFCLCIIQNGALVIG